MKERRDLRVGCEVVGRQAQRDGAGVMQQIVVCEVMDGKRKVVKRYLDSVAGSGSGSESGLSSWKSREI